LLSKWFQIPNCIKTSSAENYLSAISVQKRKLSYQGIQSQACAKAQRANGHIALKKHSKLNEAGLELIST